MERDKKHQESVRRERERPIVTSLPIRSGLRVGQNVPLGDAVAWFTHTTGLDQLAKRYTELTGKDCGCEERRKALNELIRF